MAKQTNVKKTNENKNKKETTKKEISPTKKKITPTKKNENKKTTKVEKKQVINAKSSKNKNKEVIIKNSADEVTKLVEVILVLLVIFAAFYIITYWVKKSQSKANINQEETEKAIIQYDEILLGRLFMQNNNEYYVLIIEEKDENNYQTYLTSYKEKENALRFYTAKLANAFNKSYKADTSVLNTDNIKEVKVKDTTLVKIKERKIIETFEGKTKVLEKLGELIK